MFNEKYDENSVRVVSVGGSGGSGSGSGDCASRELCGGTHVRNSRDIFPFKIISESSVASGTRRIEAVAGQAAYEYMRPLAEAATRLSGMLHVSVDGFEAAATGVMERVRELEKELAVARSAAATAAVDSYTSQLTGTTAAARVILFPVEVNAKTLREAASKAISSSSGSAAATTTGLLAIAICTISGRVVVDAAPPADAKAAFTALTSALGGNGGGDKTRAQGVLASITGAGLAFARSKLAATLPPPTKS